MKRHESLAPLSREHHDALILAQLIKRNAPVYRGLPTTITDKVQYAVNKYRDDLKEHFKKEETMLEMVKELHPSITKLSEEIFDEHKMLTSLFGSLKEAADQEAALNVLGNELEAHIRKEERILFPLVQQHCSEELLQKIQPLLV